MSDPARITPASRLVVDTIDLRRRTGTRRPFTATAAFDDLVAGDFSVVDGRVEVDLVIEAVAEGVGAAGTVTGRWTGPCRRCLEPVEGDLRVDVREIFERDPVEGETWPIDDDRIDLAPVVRESALLALPLAPLCAADCAGPEPQRFPATVARDDEDHDDGDRDDEDGGAPAPDPRWAALDELRFDG